MHADVRLPTRVPLLIGILLAAATVAFVWGAFAERSSHHDVHSKTPSAATPKTGEPPAGETSAEHAGESGAATTTTTSAGGETPAQHAAESGSPTIPSIETGNETEFHPLGVNLESTPLVVAAALLSLLLAGIVAFRPRRGVLAAVVVVATAFTILELVEVIHQTSQNRPGLVALAALAGLLHATVAVLAAGQLVTRPRIAT